MLPKLAILFSIKLVHLVFVFRANCKSPPLYAQPFFQDVQFPRTKPSIEIVSGQIKINVSLSRDPCRRNGPLLPSIFTLASSVHKIIAAHQMKTLMRPCLIEAAPFLNKKKILLPFRAVILMIEACLRRDSPHTWIMRRSVTRHLLVYLKSLFLPWLSLICFNSSGILLIISLVAHFFHSNSKLFFCDIHYREMLTKQRCNFVY